MKKYKSGGIYYDDMDEYASAMTPFLPLDGKRVFSMGGRSDHGFLEQCECPTEHPTFGLISGITQHPAGFDHTYWGEKTYWVLVEWDNGEGKHPVALQDLALNYDGEWIYKFVKLDPDRFKRMSEHLIKDGDIYTRYFKGA